MNYGSEIKRLRTKHKLEQKELADLALIQPQHLCNIEKGIRNPSEGLFLRIIGVMGYTLEKRIKKA
jgi:transcriptional regulator with XRE-family HTH domain